MAITVFKGSDATIRVNLTDKKTGALYDLNGFSGATAFFDQESSEDPLAVTGALDGSADTGRIMFSLDETQTGVLEAGDGANMEVVVDQGVKRTIVQFEGQVDIKPRLF